MPQLCADREPSFPVHLALLRCQILGSRAAGCRCRPTGEFAVADLRVLVSMPVDAVHACRSALVFEPPLAGVNYPGQRRQGCRLGQGGRLSCPMPDAYLHAFRRPGFRR